MSKADPVTWHPVFGFSRRSGVDDHRCSNCGKDFDPDAHVPFILFDQTDKAFMWVYGPCCEGKMVPKLMNGAKGKL